MELNMIKEVFKSFNTIKKALLHFVLFSDIFIRIEFLNFELYCH